ncbi:hypothetical protein [Thermoactinomyces sp. DSM 45892]|uniref:hypothetical protein n=1 Tax=Thermoactinomyces sp. DSM 45892 TaxID=1882753 RepID=UPI00089657A6|nr:hypothetical protein [Thermoactinomyces sp. DSM 45892]SDZ10535.1 hypothetical protein SAMN05444416_113108 [Thermoactinomyces sp. DSM 45892]
MKLRLLSILCGMMFYLSGCTYPNELNQQVEDLPIHIERVQSAVASYQQEKKVLPYKYKEEERIFTSKYLVDFQAISGRTEIPPTAFERGGSYLYVLTDVEKKATVRVFDLRLNDKVKTFAERVGLYYQQNHAYPLGTRVSPSLYEIDFKKLGGEVSKIRSPYHSNIELSYLISDKGVLYLDYRMDYMQFIQSAQEKPAVGTDLRQWISPLSLQVPAYSPVVKWDGKEPTLP